MDERNTVRRAPPASSAGMDHSEEMIAELDEPPDELNWSPTKLKFFLKNQPAHMQRRESLLTQQLHSETEHTDEDVPPRTLSTQSTCSNPSATSMAELTSDDGRSVASPAISPPLGPTESRDILAMPEKPLDRHIKIVGQDLLHSADKETPSEKAVEANLGRKRCISFACRGKQESKPTPPPTSEPTHSSSPSPPKRKCALKFVCPTRSGSESKPAVKSQPKRPVSPPPPPARRPSLGPKHRGSDSTVTTTSPKSVRKSSASALATAASQPPIETRRRRYSNESEDEDTSKEATRFHEFGTSDDEPEEWVQESTCHRSRLTVDDTLQKENLIRKTCEAAEEEIIEEEEDEEDEELDEELAAVAEMDDDDDPEAIDEGDESDEGFHSDNESGFASSDSEEDDSDYEWWKPGGVSTAATSVEHLDRLAIVNSQQFVPGSSIGSGSSGHMSPRGSKINLKRLASNKQTGAVPINRPLSPDLPDSTDFVCGTLDEDRPLEQAYINRMKMKDAAKHPVRPQDIDPSFPTSDPEMDEEDDDDIDEVPHQTEDDDFMHGEIELLDNAGARQQPPTRPRGRSNAQRTSPPPPTRLMSPPPAKRAVPRSPPPPRRAARSPAPLTKRARSPAPRKLFGHSPHRTKSPAPVKQMTSPPNSPTGSAVRVPPPLHGLAERPQLTHTASLPRGGPITLSKLAAFGTDDDEGSDTAAAATDVPKRGAIDIVKGVEWKRQRRKEKLYQKMCARAAAKGEKAMKVKPGKGAERMREVGLQLQQYHGKAEHILSL